MSFNRNHLWWHVDVAAPWWAAQMILLIGSQLYLFRGNTHFGKRLGLETIFYHALIGFALLLELMLFAVCRYSSSFLPLFIYAFSNAVKFCFGTTLVIQHQIYFLQRRHLQFDRNWIWLVLLDTGLVISFLVPLIISMSLWWKVSDPPYCREDLEGLQADHTDLDDEIDGLNDRPPSYQDSIGESVSMDGYRGLDGLQVPLTEGEQVRDRDLHLIQLASNGET